MGSETENRADAGVRTPADRRGFLRKAMMIGAGGTLAAAAPAWAQQAQFPRPGLTDLPVQFRNELFRIYGHEQAHVEALVDVLGDDARPKPTFRNLVQPNFRTFRAVGRALENTGTGAYLGAVPAINDPTYLSAAASIALIEARHAGVFNFLAEDPVTANVLEPDVDQDFETPLTIAQVVEQASPFILNLNNGPPLTFDPANRSDANDIAILNFALALEYLEADFYALNFQKFYPNFFAKNP